MEIIVTRKEVQETAELLALLEKWEELENIAQEHNQGEVTLKTGRNVSVCCVTDGYALRSRRNDTVCLSVKSDIEFAAAKHAAALAKEVVALIRSKLPLKVNK